MFFGETAINLDAKGRLAVPMRYRDDLKEQCGNRLVLTYSAFDSGVLWIYLEDEWQRVRAEDMDLPCLNPAHRAFKRRLVGRATDVAQDGSGRVLSTYRLRALYVR